MSLVPMPPYPWLESAWSEFAERVGQKRVPHALMISGQDGLGADTLAKAFAQLMLCISPLESIACGKCRACQLQSLGSHPDLLWIEPEEVGKQIKIDQIRKVTEFVSKTAQQGGKKVVVVTPTESMNTNSSNALLKSLEEPAGDTVLILVTFQESQILPTIKSRCARVILVPPKFSVAESWLNENNHAAAIPFLGEAGGAPLKCVEWTQSDYIEQRAKALSCLELLASQARGPIGSVGQLGGMKAQTLMELMLNLVDSLITVKLAPETERATQRGEAIQSLLSVMHRVPGSMLFRFRERLCEQKLKLIRNTNLNETLFVEELLMDWQLVAKSQ